MSLSRKYGRTYHYPFSPGATNDDRINHDYVEHISAIDTLIHTEKLDGENTCLNKYGVFARSHAVPTRHPWANCLKERWQSFKNDLGDLEIFGENLYAIHSIEYSELEYHFYVFGIRHLDTWLCWEEVCFYAFMLDFPCVPVLQVEKSPFAFSELRNDITLLANQKSTLGSLDATTQEACIMEGIVSRNTGEYSVGKFAHNVFKYVRRNHVQTDVHWTRNWRRAKLKWERSCGE